MNDCFAHIPLLKTRKYTEYFMNEFIPRENLAEAIPASGDGFMLYKRHTFYDNPIMVSLDEFFRNELKFPPLEYFAIFYHTADQPIHIDGANPNSKRYVSVNLPLSGYESTSMLFYRLINDIPANRVTNAHYFSESEVELISQVRGSNEWIMVNSGIPHRVINVNPLTPRWTLCLRFIGNPSFSSLMKNL